MNSALRIALLTHSTHPRGGVVHTLELANALHHAGHAVTVFAPASTGQRMFRPSGHAVELVPVPPAGHDIPAMVASRIDAFVNHLQHRAFDAWHAQDSIGGNALATLADRGCVDGFVRTVHHLDPFTDRRLADWQLRAFMQARQVLCVSDLWRGILKQAHGIDAARVDNGVDLQRFTRHADASDAQVAQLPGWRDDGLRILSVGGIEARKNTLRLLQAFVVLKQRLPRAQLLIAGGASLLDHDDYVGSFHQALAGAGLAADDVVITGPLPDALMPALYRAADVLAMPSLREGFGLVVLEALACGTPVVASRIAPFTEYLSDADCCFADPQDAASIAQALADALARPAIVDTPAVCRRFDWQRSAERHAALYGALPAAAFHNA